MGKRLFALVLVVLLLCVLVCPVFASSNGDIIVYRTRTGECYHTGSCSYLRSSKIEITLADAVSRGLRPCSQCNPPRYTAEEKSANKVDEISTEELQEYLRVKRQAKNAEESESKTKETTPQKSESKTVDIITWIVCGVLAIFTIGDKAYHGRRS